MQTFRYERVVKSKMTPKPVAAECVGSTRFAFEQASKKRARRRLQPYRESLRFFKFTSLEQGDSGSSIDHWSP